MVISASRRTDIPCYYSDWFFNRIKAGFLCTRNPMNPNQIKRIELTPEVIDCIFFWTKDPEPMLSRLSELDKAGYMYYFQFTITPYGKDIEKNLRNKNDIIHTFAELSKQIGKNRVIWRYDPVIINEEINTEYHRINFDHLCDMLSPYTESVTISFVDMYEKIKNRNITEISPDKIDELGLLFSGISGNYGLSINSCCEAADLKKFGIKQASCIDGALIRKLTDTEIPLKRDKNQRASCGCMESTDIGAYNTCGNGCIYCYANNSEKSVINRISRHDPEREFLLR